MAQTTTLEPPRCPDCNTVLRQLDFRRGKEAYACPVMLEAQRRGLIGKPGRKHKEARVWERKEAQSVR